MDFSQNYFEIFQLSVSFNLDTEDLSKRYRSLQSRLHPDKFVDATDHEKRLSLQWATRVNAAYQIISSDLSRAIYLLELKGVLIQENPKLPKNFLIEQIERREELDKILEDGCSMELLAAFKGEIDKCTADYLAEFSEIYLTNLRDAEIVVYKLQFFNKLSLQVSKIEDKILGF